MPMDKMKDIEERIEESWLEGNTIKTISLHTLIMLVRDGIEQCDDETYCQWRECSPNGFCRCVRDALPSYEAYQLYRELRELSLNIELAKMALEERNNGTHK
jgi:hypothetical protein